MHTPTVFRRLSGHGNDTHIGNEERVGLTG